jgi:hypothetical protein
MNILKSHCKSNYEFALNISKCEQNDSENSIYWKFMNISRGNGTLEWLVKQRFCIKGKAEEIHHIDNQF